MKTLPTADWQSGGFLFFVFCFFLVLAFLVLAFLVLAFRPYGRRGQQAYRR
jgi:hypothetical protein